MRFIYQPEMSSFFEDSHGFPREMLQCDWATLSGSRVNVVPRPNDHNLEPEANALTVSAVCSFNWSLDVLGPQIHGWLMGASVSAAKKKHKTNSEVAPPKIK